MTRYGRVDSDIRIYVRVREIISSSIMITTRGGHVCRIIVLARKSRWIRVKRSNGISTCTFSDRAIAPEANIQIRLTVKLYREFTESA